jgi:hypothetical protein
MILFSLNSDRDFAESWRLFLRNHRGRIPQFCGFIILVIPWFCGIMLAVARRTSPERRRQCGMPEKEPLRFLAGMANRSDEPVPFEISQPPPGFVFRGS